MARKGEVMNLAAMVPTLPMVRLLNGHEVQLMPFTAEGYELWSELRALVVDSENGEEVDSLYVEALADRLLQMVLPDATKDELAAFGSRLEAKMAPILGAAGQIDTVMAALDALDEGNAQADLSTSLSGPHMNSERPSPSTRNGSGKTGKGRTPAPRSRGSSSPTGVAETKTAGSD